MNFFKKTSTEKPQDVKQLREALLRFIKEQLSKAEGGEGGNIKGLHLFIAAPAEEAHLYVAALYTDETDRFKNEEVQRIADDFAIDLPASYTFEVVFADVIPPEAIRSPQLDAGLFIRTGTKALTQASTAYIKVLNGEAEKDIYEIKSSDGKITIGREKKVKGSDGFFRINTIAFPAESADAANKFISRLHAHIEFNAAAGSFYLHADEGGIPPRNKTKVLSRVDSAPIKLYSTHIGHALTDGDQVMLGESALLLFTYSEA
ncbi:MAG: hypothetical protein JWP88_629 [Flaviaesturariibacter sp.]|nr:hypothetical protein [Flaviaesturariibacter sp.]